MIFFFELAISQIDPRFHALNPLQSAWESSVSLTEGSSRCTCSMVSRNSRGCCGGIHKRNQIARWKDAPFTAPDVDFEDRARGGAPEKVTESDERAAMRFLEKDEIRIVRKKLPRKFGISASGPRNLHQAL